MTKKYMLTDSFLCYCTLQKTPIIDSSAHGRKYDYCCQIKRFKCSYLKIFVDFHLFYYDR